jgi:hypothetical protein
MRLVRIALVVAAFGLGLGIDVGESLRTGSLTTPRAWAKHKHHKKRHKRHRRHRKHGRAPATEM